MKKKINEMTQDELQQLINDASSQLATMKVKAKEIDLDEFLQAASASGRDIDSAEFSADVSEKEIRALCDGHGQPSKVKVHKRLRGMLSETSPLFSRLYSEMSKDLPLK